MAHQFQQLLQQFEQLLGQFQQIQNQHTHFQELRQIHVEELHLQRRQEGLYQSQ